MNDELPSWMNTREAAFEVLGWLMRQPDRTLHHTRILCELAEIPVVIAGGAQRDPHEALQAVDAALRGGAAGTAYGRNVIGHEAPAEMQRAVVDLVHGRDTLGDIYARLQSGRSESRA